MRIVLKKTLNEKNGLVQGAVRDWPRPLITQMTQQLMAQGITDWFAFDAGEEVRLTKMSERAAARPDLLSAPEIPEPPVPPEEGEEKTLMAEAIGADLEKQEEEHRMDRGEAPRVQRGPGRPRKELTAVEV